MRVSFKYLLAFIILFAVETIIALYIHDTVIRPLVGDILVVILLYTFIKTFVQKTAWYLPVLIFLFAAAVETAQYFNIVGRLHLESNRLMATLIGTTFDVKDVLCYFIGTVLLLVWEKAAKKNNEN